LRGLVRRRADLVRARLAQRGLILERLHRSLAGQDGLADLRASSSTSMACRRLSTRTKHASMRCAAATSDGSRPSAVERPQIRRGERCRGGSLAREPAALLRLILGVAIHPSPSAGASPSASSWPPYCSSPPYCSWAASSVVPVSP